MDRPESPVEGAAVGKTLHQEERPWEPMTFAPGHGEWFSGGGHDFEANALAVPADALPGPTPAELRPAVGPRARRPRRRPIQGLEGDIGHRPEDDPRPEHLPPGRRHRC